MNILALETSAGPASCAVWQDGQVVASAYVNTPLTHSQTLMPMVEDMLKNAALNLREMDLLAVAAGPGSFTGVRIGVAALKGLAFAQDKPCAAVSTLAAIAQNAAGSGFDGVLCAAMDARCEQVYTACFETEGEGLRRLTPDEALSIAELGRRLEAVGRPVMLLGDGAALCFAAFQNTSLAARTTLASPLWRYQQAAGVAAVAAGMAVAGQTVSAEALRPVYLRLPQAQRELNARQAMQQVNQA